MSTLSRIGLLALAGAASAFVAGAPARADIIANGVTYSLAETTVTPGTAQFDLHISGIEGVGVNAFAFSKPDNFGSAAAPSGFTYFPGGLSATGCTGQGQNFFCFQANTAPTSTSQTGSTVDLIFDVTLSSGSFADYAPDLKIQWALGNSHYDIVSMKLNADPAVVPEPVSMVLLGTGLLGLGAVQRRRRVG